MHQNLFDPFIKNCGVVILDGAMATELEKRGADLNHRLWSAKLLIENPSMIKEVHLDYLKAGADVITTSSYQASFSGLARYGFNQERAGALLLLSTSLAIQARNEAISQHYITGPSPLIAASLGPYGASLADGSEYRGHYGLSVEELMSFHRERMNVLSESGADLLACETIPCPEEAVALIRLLKEFPETKAWISFSCKSEEEVCDGTAFAECAALVNDSDQVVATGLNCTPPQFAESLVTIARKFSNKPVLVYPNKGETWDPITKCWLPAEKPIDFNQEAIRWRNAGASLIGGCCRSSPDDIMQLKKLLSQKPKH
jgi:homocysteine S-methyltransferase